MNVALDQEHVLKLRRLAEVGPNAKSKISSRADIELRKVTSIFEVTPDAAKAWEAVK